MRRARVGVGGHRLRPGGKRRAGAHREPRAKAVAGEIHVGAAQAPAHGRAAAAGPRGQKSQQIGMIQPRLHHLRPPLAQQSRQAEERGWAGSAAAHAQAVHRHAKPADGSGQCARLAVQGKQRHDAALELSAGQAGKQARKPALGPAEAKAGDDVQKTRGGHGLAVAHRPWVVIGAWSVEQAEGKR